jgi:type I restriction enzyme S subunit
LKGGYKQTEVGVIPEDWIVSKFSDCAVLHHGFQFREEHFSKEGIVVTKIGNLIDGGGLNFDDGTYIPGAKYKLFARYSLKKGDVLMALTGATLGKVSVVDYQERTLQNYRVGRFTSKINSIEVYVFYLLQSRFIQGTIKKLVNEAAQPNLGKRDFSKFIVPLPSTKREQQLIAKTLSDVDALLASLDRLIAKKRCIKQAAMQQLLTGQIRLPGFRGDWIRKRLGDVAHIKTGGRNNEDKVDDGLYPFFVRSDVVERINSYSHDCEAILIPGEGRIGSIFHYIMGRFDVHQRVYAITDFKPDISAKFVHFCMSKNFGAWAMQNTVKATVDSLRLPTFQTFDMNLPATLSEQIAIAEVLTDMDAELAALEQRWEKTRALKQGMMQELLTGRIRLV